MRARQQARQSAREARKTERTAQRTDSSSNTQQQPRRVVSLVRDAINKSKDSRQRAANEREAINAANAYGRSMGVAPRNLIGGIGGGSQSRYEDFTNRVSAGRPILSFFNRLERGLGFNDGGIAVLPGYADGNMVEDFPRVNGPISGPGTETSDDIPAMLSDGEFVMTAKAVRGAGGFDMAKGNNGIVTLTPNGDPSRDSGTRVMYKLMEHFGSVA